MKPQDSHVPTDEQRRWTSLRRLFDELVARPHAERAERLARAPVDDSTRRALARLLAADVAENGALPAPRRLGRYELGARIGQGGMGEVHLAHDVDLDRHVALKLLAPHMTEDSQWLDRFQREARAASAVNHPGVLTIHEVGVAEGVHFIATEFVEGETLRARIARGSVASAEVLALALQIADALAAAHAVGIVHRDVKPENVMVRPDGLVKLLDFGLARTSPQMPREAIAGESDRQLTRTGVVMGTLAYLSPEQARGLDADARTDVFAFGVVLYEMLTGALPFEGATPLDALVALLQHDPAPLPVGLEAAHPGLGQLIARALAKSRERRFDSARELAVELRALAHVSGGIPQEQVVAFEAPPVRYAQSGEINIAFQVLGSGPPDLVFVMGWVSHLESFWTEPGFARFLRRLGSFARVILFDKRGTGLSDRVPTRELPTLEQRMDDVRAVMDAVGSEAAVLCGVSEGGPMCCLFAATYPERTLGLVMIGSYARRLRDDDYPWGPTAAEREAFLEELRRTWGGPVGLETRAPSRVHDTRFRDWWASYLRQGASPTAVVALTRMNSEVDVRKVLPSVRVPTLVVHRLGDKCLVVDEGRYLASRIPAAQFLQLEGEDHLPFVGDQDTMLDGIESFVRTLDSPGARDRVLATVLVVEAPIGLDGALRRVLDAQRGRVFRSFEHDEVDGASVCVLASFDGPARAIRAGLAVVRAADPLERRPRVGLHTGECDVSGAALEGGAVEFAERLASRANPGEVLVSSTVHDLVAGAGLALEGAGEVDGGALGTLRLYRAVQAVS